MKKNNLFQQEKNAKFYYASQKMFLETKIIKVSIYLISIIPIVLSIIKGLDNKVLIFTATMISFALSLITEFMSSFLTNHKEQSILLSQFYEASVTDCIFSKVQYDREMTNSLNELAIRKSAKLMNDVKEYHEISIPEELNKKYDYLYICRINAAKTNYLMSRMYGLYIFALIVVILLFISFSFIKNETYEFLMLIIQFYPLVLPIIRNIASSQKTMRYCTKISADIDNYFAELNTSNEELARFIYYAQNLEFECLMASPAKYSIFYKIFNRGLKILEKGVTKRFIEQATKLDNVKHKTAKPTEKKVENKKEIVEKKEQLKLAQKTTKTSTNKTTTKSKVEPKKDKQPAKNKKTK